MAVGVRARSRECRLEWTKRFLQTHEDYWTITAEVREITEG